MEDVGTFYGHSAWFVVIWYFSRFGILYREKSGNPDRILRSSNLQRKKTLSYLYV
jgi:hypothetical protein